MSGTATWGKTYGERLLDLVAATDAARPRSQQTAPGISELGGCPRAVAYKASGTEPSDPENSHPAAMIGTWLHEILLPLMADAWGGLHSIKVVARWDGLPEVPGEVDLALPAEKTVLDLKTGTENKMQQVVRDGAANPRHRIQAHTYAAFLREVGMDIDWVSVLYLGRSRGEHVTFTEPFDQVVVDEGRAWYEKVLGYVDDPDAAPRGEKGPGLSIVCDGCPFRTRCWPNRQASIVDEGGSAAVGEALAGYADAAARKSLAEKDQKFYSAILSGTEAGEYGVYRLAWQRGKEYLDQPTARAMLTQVGLVPPVKFGRPSIAVKRLTS